MFDLEMYGQAVSFLFTVSKVSSKLINLNCFLVFFFLFCGIALLTQNHCMDVLTKLTKDEDVDLA